MIKIHEKLSNAIFRLETNSLFEIYRKVTTITLVL